MYYLSLCCLIKDENVYLREWLDYHRLIGVEHFFIYDNGSQVSVRETLAPEVAQGWVTVVDIPGRGPQLPAYAHCLRQWGSSSRWIGFIDTDEFIVPKTTSDMRAFLAPYEPYGGLGIYWLTFGASGHRTRPAGLQIQNFTLATPATFEPNSLIKSVVQPAYCFYPARVHHFIYRPGYGVVNENFAPILDPQHPPRSTSKIQLNHYYIRSEAEFREKIARGSSTAAVLRTMDDFYASDRPATVEDRSILNLLKDRWPSGGAAELAAAAQLAPPAPGELADGPAIAGEPFQGLELRLLSAWAQAALAQADWRWLSCILGVTLWRFEAAAWQAAWFEEAYLALSLAVSAPGETALAQTLEALTNAIPLSPAFLCRVGVDFFVRGDVARAEKAFRQVVQLAPETLEARTALGRLYFDQGRYPEARAQLRAATLIDPLDVETWVGLALVADALHDDEGLAHASECARHLDPTQWLAQPRLRLKAGSILPVRSASAPQPSLPGEWPTGRIPIAMPTYNRPDYLQHVIQALRQCDQVDQFMLVTSEEPGFPEVAAIIETVDFMPVARQTHDGQWGGNANSLFAIQSAFALNDWAVVLQDDVVPAPDFLNLMLWGLRTFKADPAVAAVCGYRSDQKLEVAPNPQRLAAAQRLRRFAPWGWATWKDRWEAFFYSSINLRVAQCSWDSFFVYNYLLARRERDCLFPVIGRTQIVGDVETHMSSVAGQRPNQHPLYWNGAGQYRAVAADAFRLEV